MTTPDFLEERLIKALGHPLRWRLLEVLIDRGEASPLELSRLLDVPLATVSHHVRVLRDLRCVELMRTEPRRGAVEHYYRALLPAFLDDDQWARVPTMLRRSVAGQIFRRVVREAALAGEKGAFDAPGAHVDRMLVELDDRGWEELSELLLDVLRRTQEIQARSDARRADGTSVRTSELAILHFEMAESIGSSSADDPEAPRPARSPPLPATAGRRRRSKSDM
jgi:DNA-binding transcriptional ArsR family regulator